MITMDQFYQIQDCTMRELGVKLDICRSAVARQRTGTVTTSAVLLMVINNWELCEPLLAEAIEHRQQLQDLNKAIIGPKERVQRFDTETPEGYTPSVSEEVYAKRLRAAHSTAATSPPNTDYVKKLTDDNKKDEPSFM